MKSVVNGMKSFNLIDFCEQEKFLNVCHCFQNNKDRHSKIVFPALIQNSKMSYSYLKFLWVFCCRGGGGNLWFLKNFRKINHVWFYYSIKSKFEYILHLEWTWLIVEKIYNWMTVLICAVKISEWISFFFNYVEKKYRKLNTGFSPWLRKTVLLWNFFR